MSSFRASYQGALKTKPVLVSIVNGTVTITDAAGNVLASHRRHEATLRRYKTSDVLFMAVNSTGARSGTYRVEPDDEHIAETMFKEADFASPSDPFWESMPNVPRWQYAVVNIGSFNSAERMQSMLARAGSHGWELTATMDKQSNWWNMEKGFLLLKRPVPEGHKPQQWCIFVSGTTS